MAWSSAWGGFSGAALNECSHAVVNAVDTEQVCTQIGNDEIVSCWIWQDMVGVRGVLAAWNLAWTIHRVFESLKRLGTSEWEVESRNLARLTALINEGSNFVYMTLRDELVGVGDEGSSFCSSIERCRYHAHCRGSLSGRFHISITVDGEGSEVP